jgi:V-type ATP synthase beta chain
MKKVYSKIESINGSVITVKAEDVSYGELAQVQTSFGASLAQVNKLDRGILFRYRYLQADAAFPPVMKYASSVGKCR